MNARLYALVTIVGLVATLAIAAQVDMLSDTIPIARVAVGASVVVGVLGWLVLWSLRWRSVRVQMLVVALVSVLGTVAGVEAAAQQMFVSGHDRDVLFVVATAAGTVAVLTALVLGSRVGKASRSVSELTREIGEGVTPVEGRARPVTGEFGGLAVELARMASKLEASRQREHELEQARRELVAWVSHDLRTPMAAIRAMVEAIEDGVVSDEATIGQYHRNIHSEVDRLSGLVDDLFELSRIHAGGLGRHHEEVNLVDLVSDALASARPRAGEHRISLDGRLTEKRALVMGSDRDLSRALANLIDNALHHTPDDGKVLVGLAAGAKPNTAMIEVADSGPGVPTERRRQIFEIGHTGDAARRRGGGSGLGLAIAKGFVEAHDGSIEVDDAPDLGGARFTVVLPLIDTAKSGGG